VIAACKVVLIVCMICRTKFRREANQADNKAATTAVDSLINYEAVKVNFTLL
jgi:ABC-type transport system involved in Fe-S cluster assembly fused permease/ATPase subunit